MPSSILIGTIIKKTTGNITVIAVRAGAEVAEKTLPFDMFIQIIDGVAQVKIGGKKCNPRLGEGIIIPVHSPHRFNANGQFKMISAIIKVDMKIMRKKGRILVLLLYHVLKTEWWLIQHSS